MAQNKLMLISLDYLFRHHHRLQGYHLQKLFPSHHFLLLVHFLICPENWHFRTFPTKSVQLDIPHMFLYIIYGSYIMKRRIRSLLTISATSTSWSFPSHLSFSIAFSLRNSSFNNSPLQNEFIDINRWTMMSSIFSVNPNLHIFFEFSSSDNFALVFTSTIFPFIFMVFTIFVASLRFGRCHCFLKNSLTASWFDKSTGWRLFLFGGFILAAIVRQMLVNNHGIVVNSSLNQLCKQRTPIYISLWKISFVQEFIFAPFGSLQV